MTLEAGHKFAALVAACAVCLGSWNSLGLAQTKTSQINRKGNAMTQTGAAQLSGGPSTAENAIRPFQVRIPEQALVDLRNRIAATRWPDKETVTDASQGVQLATLQKLARYWSTSYDWRKCEARLNALPQFVTTIDGVDIQFIHVKSKYPNALPIIITHGWPGSVVEQLKLIGPLTDPTAYGGTPEDAFDVVIPSIPGFGFSGKPTTTGWGPEHIARAWVTLMKRLGYNRFVASGGDWGAMISDVMGAQAPPELLGIHLTWPFMVPAEIDKAVQTGSPLPSDLSVEERTACARLASLYQHGLGYAQEMSTRPQTMYAIEDSPVGLAAWMLDHDDRSYALISRVFDGQTEGLTRDDILDNITLNWLTKTAVSSARIYWENKGAFFAAKHVTIPVAFSAFPDEVFQAPRNWAEKAYPNLVYFKTQTKGGHFAAWEQPALYSADVRAAFRSLRQPATSARTN
jgi:pimeloyl-ACP methyl ester carboxylesterase